MKHINVLLFIICLVMLGGCQSENTSNNQDETNEKQQAEKAPDEQSVVEEDSEENEPLNESTDVSGVLDAVAEAMSKVNGIALEGEVESHTNVYGVESNSKSKVSGVTILEPYAQHTISEVISSDGEGEGEISEMYTLDQTTYVGDPSDGWMSMDLGPEQMAAEMSDTYFENFKKHHELFTLEEDGNNYYLSFEASGDLFIEVLYGGWKVPWGEEAYEQFIDMIEDPSGEYRYTIDKETFRAVALSYETKMIMYGSVETEDSVTYTYSKFNEVDDIVVPDDVIENAQSLTDLGLNGEE